MCSISYAVDHTREIVVPSHSKSKLNSAYRVLLNRELGDEEKSELQEVTREKATMGWYRLPQNEEQKERDGLY